MLWHPSGHRHTQQQRIYHYPLLFSPVYITLWQNSTHSILPHFASPSITGSPKCPFNFWHSQKDSYRPISITYDYITVSLISTTYLAVLLPNTLLSTLIPSCFLILSKYFMYYKSLCTLQSAKYLPETPSTSSETARYSEVWAPSRAS